MSRQASWVTATAAIIMPTVARTEPRQCDRLGVLAGDGASTVTDRMIRYPDKMRFDGSPDYRAVRCHMPPCVPDSQRQNPSSSAAFMLVNMGARRRGLRI